MAKQALLNNIDHPNLKIDTTKSAALGNNVMYSLVFPFEFQHVQADYPIFFNRHPESGEFYALAMFGFEKEENLYLKDGGWDADYIPLMVEREPFYIGFQEDAEGNKNSVIHIDLDSPRVGTETGTAVFLEHGGNSDYLNHVSNILKAIDDSQSTTALFMQKMAELQLLESFNLDIQLTDGSNNRLSGFYTINEEKLHELSAEQLAQLNSSGLLRLIYMVIASHSQIKKLINRKDKILTNKAAAR